jgi:hypothetical protein
LISGFKARALETLAGIYLQIPAAALTLRRKRNLL